MSRSLQTKVTALHCPECYQIEGKVPLGKVTMRIRHTGYRYVVTDTKPKAASDAITCVAPPAWLQ